jgi:hypothetical protein
MTTNESEAGCGAQETVIPSLGATNIVDPSHIFQPDASVGQIVESFEVLLTPE